MSSIIPQYDGRSNIYTYMAWQLITDTSSDQYKLREDAGQNFDSEGFGRIGDAYVIACTSTFGNIGDYITWTLADGSKLKTIVGDEKSQQDENCNAWGHIEGNSISIIEFVVDKNTWYTNPMHANPGTATCHPEWAGIISLAENTGNYWTGNNAVNTSTGKIAYVTCDRYLDSAEPVTAYYVGANVGGYIFFNDFRFFRCLNDGTLPSVLHRGSNTYWTDTNEIANIKVNITDLNSLVNGGNNGAGSAAGNAQVEQAVRWMVEKANSGSITYSNDNRWGPTSYDCSSFVISAFRNAGFTIDANTTFDMIPGFEAAGFVWHPATSSKRLEAKYLQRGDILLNIENHTQVYIGGNYDVNCGSTPARVKPHVDYYEYKHASYNGWDGYLRYGK